MLSRKVRWMGVILVSLFGFSGCSQEQASTQEPTPPLVVEQKPEPSVESLSVAAPIAEPTPELASAPKASAVKKMPLPPEPAGVNGLQPFVEAQDKLTDQILVQNLRKQAKGKVQVIEFFNYPCPWCALIEPSLKAWLKTKPKDVIFIRVPVLFHPSWGMYCKVYYAIEALAVKHHIRDTTAIHAAFFEKTAQNPQINRDLPAIYAFFVEQKLMEKDNEKTFVEMINAIDEHPEIAQAYGIRAIPTFVVQGKKNVYSTNISIAGTPEHVFTTIGYLTAINSQ